MEERYHHGLSCRAILLVTGRRHEKRSRTFSCALAVVKAPDIARCNPQSCIDCLRWLLPGRAGEQRRLSAASAKACLCGISFYEWCNSSRQVTSYAGTVTKCQ